MVFNLRENFLYEKLTDAVISADEKGLIQAVVGGLQDRVSDLRAYASKLNLFYTPGAFPETTVNAVLVDVTTDTGVVVTRSLEISASTPPASSPIALGNWVAQQLCLSPSQFANVRYGLDLLRQVNADTLGYLAATLGAILYAAPLSPDQTLAQQQLVATYFPRLQIKGTIQSFEALGRILGFDDVKVTPLWSRVSPRLPQDAGNPANDVDFAQVPDYQPQQEVGIDYDPTNTRDGPFYLWQGTVSNVLTDTDYYESVINGYSPFITVSTYLAQAGTVTHPSTGSYALAGGNAYTEATVVPPGSGVQFTALVQGDAYSGLEVNVVFSGTGSLAVISVYDQLSSIKYRSAYYDVALTAHMSTVEDVFGALPAQPNADLLAGTNTADGIAVSPFRAWEAGSIAVPTYQRDYLTFTEVSNGTTVITVRNQALPTDHELNVADLVAAGVAVAQAFEEVRPATRSARTTSTGFVHDDAVPYAFYGTQALLFVSDGSATYSGTDTSRPLPDYQAEIEVVNGTGTFLAVAASDPVDPFLWHYLAQWGSVTLTGSYEFLLGTYAISIVPDYGSNQVYAQYTLTSTEVIRSEPSYGELESGMVHDLARPEDDLNGTYSSNELADEYPWRRSVVGGGELIEVDTYLPYSPDIAAIAVAGTECVFQDQTRTEYSVRAVYPTLPSSGTHMRYLCQARSTSPYVPGMLPIGYAGTFVDLSTLSPQELWNINNLTDSEILFGPAAEFFHTGLAQGVLVADAPGFFGPHHRAFLVGWFPFNEHAEDPLQVIDHSVINGTQHLEGVLPSSRQWSDERGWYMDMRSAGAISSADFRGWGTEQTVSFWFNGSVSGSQPNIVQSGGLSFDYSNGTISAYASSGGAAIFIGSATMEDWQFVYLRRSGAQAVFGNGSLAGNGPVETTVNGNFDADPATAQVVIQSGTLTYGIHDLRIWNTQKQEADMALVLYPNPTPTVVNYPIGFMLSVGEQDRFGLRVLPNGWLTTDVMPAWVRRPAMAWVTRYDYLGRYEAESAFDETGLGDGPPLPVLYQLGGQYCQITSTGTTITSTGTGQLPGVNELWLTNTDAGTYVTVVDGTGTYVGTNAMPWPNNMVQTNPIREQVWVKGDDGFVYEVTLDGTLAETNLQGAIVGRYRMPAEILVNPIYFAVLSTGTYWEVTPTSTTSGTLVGNAGTFTITTQ